MALSLPLLWAHVITKIHAFKYSLQMVHKLKAYWVDYLTIQLSNLFQLRSA
jgi:hypothetical protein